ncbi:MAG: methylated-DNA--[protein]-cysteine S-methyltransferase [Pseudonocardiaceae bacterium]
MAWTTMPAPAPVGQFTLGVTGQGVGYLSFGGGLRGLSVAARSIGATLITDHAWTVPAVRQLTEYLQGRRRAFELPIDWRLTSGVQRAVLTTLYDSVGYGDTITYGELAVRSGAFGAAAEPHSARGVGSIMGSNPIPVLVPCHRVLGAADLGGFGGGLAVKRWLLALEGAMTPSLDFETI